jgi:hypothetical protein
VSDELEILKSVTAKLDSAGIPYMVTGSMAANYYATPRMTRDIDLVVELSEEDVSRVVRLFHDEYYVDPDMVRQAVQNQSMFNMIHNALVVKVDCVVRKDSEYRREEFARRRAITVTGQRMTIVAPEDLILSKLQLSQPLGRTIGTCSALPGGPAMNDTSPAVDEHYRAKLMQRTGEERLIMGCAMRDAARALIEASFLEQDPCTPIATLRKGLFLRLYGHEFDAETQSKIIGAIQEAARVP